MRLLHELTKHGDGLQTDDERLVAFRRLDPANRPAPFKAYRLRPTHPLPDDLPVAEGPAGPVLSGSSLSPGGRIDDRALARLLFLTAGVTRVAHPGGGRAEPVWFRAAMSAGNLHPVEVYVVCGELPGLAAGVYHFTPREFALTPLRTGDFRGVLAGAAADPSLALSPATLVLTGIPWRTGWKYAERGYRHLFWDAGAMFANLLAAGDAAGIPVDVLAGFVDGDVSQLIGVDGTAEFPLALAALCRDQVAGPPAPAPPVHPLNPEVVPLSPHPIVLPLVVDAHEAGSLASPDTVADWRRGGEHEATEAKPAPGAPLTAPEAGEGTSLDEVILRRGSTRRIRRERVDRQVLDWGLAVAARPVPGDIDAPLRPLLSHHVSVHAVYGVEPGAYRWQTGRWQVLRTGDLRQHTQHLCLDQPLGGDAAFTTFHTARLDEVFARLGPRGYRAAQLCAGIAAGRLALAAFTLGCGATGITFLDDSVARFFSTHESCLLATAVGRPAYRNRRGGRPRAPTELALLVGSRLR